MPSENSDDLDRPIRGAKKIGLEAGYVDDDGVVDERATYHALESGYLDAWKRGRQWFSTPRRLRRPFTGEGA
jgi:hypothetical protein